MKYAPHPFQRNYDAKKKHDFKQPRRLVSSKGNSTYHYFNIDTEIISLGEYFMIHYHNHTFHKNHDGEWN